MDKNQALELWMDEMGDQIYAYDFSGKKIKREDFNIKNEVGWIVSYVKPIHLGGKNNKGNIIIMHHRTADEKANNYPEFEIGHKKYMAYYNVKEDFYYIEECLDEED